MSRAEELLDSLTEDQIATYGINPSDEPHIVIESDKTITVPDDLKHIAVQGEHNIETVTFDCPRYWDGHDLSQMQMCIVYQRPDGHREPHLVENLRVDDVDENTIHFEWTISGNVTAVKGNISFMVCAKISDAEGIREREWHSRLNQDFVIDEGMGCSGNEIVEQNPDIIEAILVQLDDLKNTGGVSDEQVANAVAAYLAENPIESGVDEQEVRNILAAYLEENPPEGGTVTDEQVANAVAAYLAENPIEITDVVKTINGTAPDENGNVEITIPDSGQNGADLTNVQTILRNVMTIIRAQVEDTDGTPQAYSMDISGLAAECDALIAGLAGSGGGTTEKTLTGISATYSGGSVAVGTAVSDLTGIVVTATYDDGSTAVVTGYTLSGTIAEGENTITVTYEGMTAAFTVTGVAESSGDDSEPFVNLFAANLRRSTSEDNVAGIGTFAGNYINTDADIQLTAGVTYYAYSLFTGTAYALTVFVNDGSGVYTNSGLSVTKTGTWLSGTYDDFGNEKKAGYTVEIDGTAYNLYQMAFTPAEDCSVRLAFSNRCVGHTYPDYNYLFTQEYNPHKNSLG